MCRRGAEHVRPQFVAADAGGGFDRKNQLGWNAPPRKPARHMALFLADDGGELCLAPGGSDCLMDSVLVHDARHTTNVVSVSTTYVVRSHPIIPAMSIGERAKLRRNELKLSQAQVAEAMTRAGFRMTQQGVAKIEAGGTERPRGLREMAVALKTSDEWLLEETGPKTAADVSIAVAGYVGAGAIVAFFDDHERGAGLEMVERPPGLRKDVVAVRVRGDSAAPVYEDGDTLFYAEDDKRDPAELVSRPGSRRTCIVRLRDGRTFLKMIRHGSRKGRWNLASHNPAVDDIVDVQIEWTAAVRWVSKAV